MAYAGLWIRSRSPAANNLGGVIDPRHLKPVDYGPTPDSTPDSTPAYAAPLYAGADEWLPQTVVQVPIVAPGLDSEPVGHEYGTVARGGTRLADGTNSEAHAARSRDAGAADAARTVYPVERAADDRYATERYEESRAVSTSRTALVRGRNSLPENNPEGPPPQGSVINRWINRRMPRRPFKTDLGPLWAYRATLAKRQEVPKDANQYVPPWASLQVSRHRRTETPMIRRTPRQYGEDAITDGISEPQPEQQFWAF